MVNLLSPREMLGDNDFCLTNLIVLTGFGRDMVDERCIIIIIRRGAIISGVDALFTM